jgi:hypothetical protein
MSPQLHHCKSHKTLVTVIAEIAILTFFCMLCMAVKEVAAQVRNIVSSLFSPCEYLVSVYQHIMVTVILPIQSSLSLGILVKGFTVVGRVSEHCF